MSEYGTYEIRTMFKSELPGVPISDSSDFRQLGFWNYNLGPKAQLSEIETLWHQIVVPKAQLSEIGTKT